MTLRRTRVGTIPDMHRIGVAVSHPGIDPRIWCSYAWAASDSALDAAHGDFVDIVLRPSGQELTARVPQSYAGKDFGTNEGRIKKDDELLVLLPMGDPAEGVIVVARLWGATDTPPKLAQDNPKDYVRVQEKDTNMRYKLEGKALVELEIGDFTVTIDNNSSPTVAHFKTQSGDVFKLTKDGLELGLSPSDDMALASPTKSELSKLHDKLDSFINTYNSHDHIFTGLITAGSPVTQTQTAPVTVMATTSKGPTLDAVGDVKSAFVKSK